MKLEELLKDVTVKAIEGAVDTDITDVNIDSRKVAKGHLFVAIKLISIRVRWPRGICLWLSKALRQMDISIYRKPLS